MNFQSIDGEELTSSLYDGENLPNDNVKITDNDLEHMQNWSVIGATMRNEKTGVITKNFASSVINSIKEENIVPDPVEIEVMPMKNTSYVRAMFNKFAFGLSQLAIAASVAAVTIIGYQTYNAEGAATSEISASVSSLGVANLASYQTKHNDSNKIMLNDRKSSSNADKVKVTAVEADEQKLLEVERINGYIKNYVVGSALGN